jgi:hypothetical protein
VLGSAVPGWGRDAVTAAAVLVGVGLVGVGLVGVGLVGADGVGGRVGTAEVDGLGGAAEDGTGTAGGRVLTAGAVMTGPGRGVTVEFAAAAAVGVAVAIPATSPAIVSACGGCNIASLPGRYYGSSWAASGEQTSCARGERRVPRS